jgi:2-keto-4-pentenoate hydratase
MGADTQVPAAEALARALDAAERDRRPLAPLTETHPDLTLDAAYAIQRAGLRLRQARGSRLVGRKVGLTSTAMQEMLGVEQPDFGYLTDAMVLSSGSSIDAGALIAPRVEAEIAFLMAAPLAGRPDRDEVLAATDAVAPAIEVIDSRVADWRIAITDTVADNASSARVVLGGFRPLPDADLAAASMELSVTRPDGASERVAGTGEAVLGHPAHAIAWLVAALDRYGERLEAADVVLPGAMARALPVGSGDAAVASFPQLGEVAVTFADGAS